MRLATASGRRSQQSPDQTSTYRCGRSRLRRLGQPYQPLPRPEFFNGIGQERKPDPGDDQVRFAPIVAVRSNLSDCQLQTFGGSAERVWKGQLPLPSASATASADLQLRSIFNRLHKKRRGGGEAKEKVRLYG